MIPGASAVLSTRMRHLNPLKYTKYSCGIQIPPRAENPRQITQNPFFGLTKGCSE
jgi:hypothetical protein